MKTGIVGLPASGKTTLFKALVPGNTLLEYEKPNIGSIKVPDKNVDELADFFKPKKKTYAEIIIVDIPGAPTGPENAKRRNEIFSHIKKVDAFIEVVNAFSRSDIYEEIITFESDLILSDIDIVEKRLDRLSKEKLDPQKEFEKRVLEKCYEELDKELPLRNLEITKEEKHALSSFEFYSIKPVIYVINIQDSALSKSNEVIASIRNKVQFKNTEILCMPLKLEQEISELNEEEKKEFLSSYGLNEPALPEVIRVTMDLLGLNVFYTVGEDEVKAWLFEKSLNARATAGKVHSDIERGFIAAEVISYDDFKLVGFSFKEAKAKGFLRIEGENYVVKDKEVVHFRFNV